MPNIYQKYTFFSDLTKLCSVDCIFILLLYMWALTERSSSLFKGTQLVRGKVKTDSQALALGGRDSFSLYCGPIHIGDPGARSSMDAHIPG